MREIDIEHYKKPTNEELKNIINKIEKKKEYYYSVALSCGTVLFGVTTIIALIFFFYDILLLTYPMAFCFIGYYVGICCFIAAYRCYWEKKLFKDGDFVVRECYVKEMDRKHAWKTIVTVCYSDKTTENFSIIKPDVRKNDKAYVAIVNQKFAPWVLPRVIGKK